ncbi:HSF-type DNA-binding-domain-containing protein [Radiomyces spectabilis]|uniref:HSF-type DNA-binding-domain-containing protein n=1 Tax=Radiomyces spectabilis TaxID=64574 RepID=UPI00221E96B4|nr:HSF-type DNA-binding-domain-containing protein [Radiomyces spectabilis]KAI8365218.1 HSF-type DNA-binding-domain-containing protein [Radiomyces spectabilis]
MDTCTSLSTDSWSMSPSYPSGPYTPTDLESLEFSRSERGIAGFVSKLYDYVSLQSSDNEKYAHWCRHDGKDMFIIDCIPKIVLPRLFKHCKFPSFVRQLNIYGFQRDTDARKSKDSKDKEICRWYHPFFRPGRRDLFHLIRRKGVRCSRRKRAKSEEDPETILNLGSGDESDNDEMGSPSQQDEDGMRSSSASSPSPSVPQHQEPLESATVVPSSPAQPDSANDVPSVSSDPSVSLTEPKGEEHTNPAVAPPVPTSSTASTVCTPAPTETNLAMQEHELGVQLIHMKKEYNKMQRFLTEQLNKAYFQIQSQQQRIQQLEEERLQLARFQQQYSHPHQHPHTHTQAHPHPHQHIHLQSHPPQQQGHSHPYMHPGLAESPRLSDTQWDARGNSAFASTLPSCFYARTS